MIAVGCVPSRLQEQVDVTTISDSERFALLYIEESGRGFSPDEGSAFSPMLLETSTAAMENGFEQYLWWTQEPYDVEPILSSKPIRYDLPQAAHSSVEMWIRFLQGRGRKWYELWLARSTRYVPIFYSVLDEYKLPRDLVFLAMVESGFSPRAFSSAAAAGPWQFMPETGRRYGLRVGFWVDERRDFEKAAVAAARHLRWLYSRFGDWHLAMAGYNAGAGRIASALKRSRTRRFWDLYKTRWIRRETKHYVPKILAAAKVSKEPEKYGFVDIKYEPPMAYDTVVVDVSTSLVTIGEACGGLPKIALEELNPSLRVSVTPPDESWSVRVPPGLGESCREGLQEIAPENRYTFRYYRTSMGESPEAIAHKFETDLQTILQFHEASDVNSLGYYPEMAVPVRLQLAKKFAVETPGSRERSAKYQASSVRVVRYVTRRGDSLRKIAKEFGVSIQQIQKWNQLGRSSTIRSGRTLAMYLGHESKLVPSSPLRMHRVKKGESLWVIARRYDVSIGRLCRLNGLKPGQKLQIGQVLRTR